MTFQIFSELGRNESRRMLCLLIIAYIYASIISASSSASARYSVKGVTYTDPDLGSISTEMQYPEIDSLYFSELINNPKKQLKYNPFYEIMLPGFGLYECSCPESSAHDRFLKGNTRTKIENLVVEHVTKRLSGKPIRILSLGSGGCLQDLMVVA